MNLVDLYPELEGIDVDSESTKIPLNFLSEDDQIQLGKLLAEYTVDNMPRADSSESVNYTYQYYFNVASLPNKVIVEALLKLKQEA